MEKPTPTTVFLAHPKDAPDDKLAEWSVLIKWWLRDADYDATVVLGREDYARHAASEGNFDGWARSVPTRRDTFTGEKVYDSIFVPGYVVGKATAVILETAFAVKLPVFVIDDRQGDVVFHHATAIETMDDQDYKTGWRVVLD